MPSTRSQSHTQPTLDFPRCKSCRVSSRSKIQDVTQVPVQSTTKLDPQLLTQTLARIRPLSPRRSDHQPTPLSPIHSVALPPSLQPRLPLSPRKRTGEHLSEQSFTYFEFMVILLPLACKGDDNSCNLSPGPLSSPPKQSKTSVTSPRKLGFDENSPVTARRQLVPLSPPHANSPAPSSPRRQETPFKSPARTNFKGKLSDAHLLNKGKSYSSL